MGEVTVTIRVSNMGDMLALEEGRIEPGQVRRAELKALVDTGAMMLMLPQDEVAYLGLREHRKVTVRYADERTEERAIAGPIFLELPGDWGDRSMLAECIVGPPGCEALVGQIILEAVDLMVDCVDRRLRARPESPHRPMIKLK